MKKFLPFILLLVGILVLGGVFLFIKNGKSDLGVVSDEETTLLDVPLDERPVVSLTPTTDGHYLNLKIDKIMIAGAESMDYELIYQVSDGLSQGVPGSVDVRGKTSFEAELLLGSESSGKFRYDEGVESGTLTIRFRNESGSLLAKFSTDFSLLNEDADLKTPDGKFSVKLSNPKPGFFVLMETFGVPKSLDGISQGPYGLFSSSELKGISSEVELGGGKLYLYDGSDWQEFENGELNGGFAIFVSAP
jgi:hypothetical protein